MRNTQRLFLIFIFSLCCFVSINVSANDYDFFIEERYDSLEEAEEALAKQGEKAKEFDESLEDCTSLEIDTNNTGIYTEVEDLAEERVETEEEKNTIIAKHEENGYVVSFEMLEEDATKTTYSFEVENGVVRSAKVNDEESDSYVDLTIEEILASFNDEEENDYRIVYTIDSNDTPVNENGTVQTFAEVEEEIERLEALGYTVTWVQNDEETKIETLPQSPTKMTNTEIINILESRYPDKEIIIKSISDATEIIKDQFVSEKYDDEDEAIAKKAELEEEYDYVSVKTETLEITEEVTVKTGENKVSTGNEVESAPVDVTTEGVRVENEDGSGYKVYYLVEDVVVSEEQNVLVRNLSESECSAMKEDYINNKGYDRNNVSCTEVSSTTIVESTDDTYHFNDTSESELITYSHLDVSVEQNIVVVDELGREVDVTTGTFSNVSGYYTRNGSTVNLVYSQTQSQDGSRWEYCQTNSTDGHCGRSDKNPNEDNQTSFSITNQDLVTLNVTVSYTYNNQNFTKNVVLEGYLKEAFNECSMAPSSFDLKITMYLTEDGEIIVSVVSDSTWTFTAHKDAVVEDKIYYDEYEYTYTTNIIEKEVNKYYVEAYNVDYSYDVSYIATDYSYTYTGTTSTVSVLKEEYDRDFIINGSKTTYIVRTAGIIVEDDTCDVGDEGEPIVPPHTGANVVVSYNNVVIIEDKKRRK